MLSNSNDNKASISTNTQEKQLVGIFLIYVAILALSCRFGWEKFE